MLDEYWCGWWWWEPVRMPSYQQHYSNSNWIGMDLQLIEMKLMSSAAEAEDDLKCEEGASLCCCFVNQSRLMIIVKVGTNSVFNNLITQFWMESWSLIIIHVLVTHLVDRRNRCFINRMLLLQFRNQIDGLMTCITSFSWQVPRNSKINWNMLIRSLRYRCNRPTPTDTEVKGRGSREREGERRMAFIKPSPSLQDGMEMIRHGPFDIASDAMSDAIIFADLTHGRNCLKATDGAFPMNGPANQCSFDPSHIYSVIHTRVIFIYINIYINVCGYVCMYIYRRVCGCTYVRMDVNVRVRVCTCLPFE